MQNLQTLRPYIKSTSAFVLLCGAILLDGYLLRRLMPQSRQDQRKPEENVVIAAESIAFAVVTMGIALALRHFIKQNRRVRQSECLVPEGVKIFLQSKVSLNQSSLQTLARCLHQDGVNVVGLLQVASASDASLKLTELFLSTEVALTHYNSQLIQEHNFHNLNLDDIKNRHLTALQKQATHECILTIVWLAVGAFGWELFYLYTLVLMNYSSNDVLLDNKHPDKKLLLWLSAGFGCYVFLIAGMTLGHLILSNFFGGRPVHESYFQMKQFLISVTIADGFWMLFTDLPRVVCHYLMIQGMAEAVLAPMLAIGFYLMESFLFKNLQNALNFFHREDDQAKWECDNAYTAILWANYWGFNVVASWIRQAMGVSAEATHPGEIILIALAGGLGAALPALLINLGLIFEHLRNIQAVWIELVPATTDVGEIENGRLSDVAGSNLQEKLIPSTTEQTSHKVCDYIQSALILFSQRAVAAVQLAEDMCPSPEIF